MHFIFVWSRTWHVLPDIFRVAEQLIYCKEAFPYEFPHSGNTNPDYTSRRPLGPA